VRIGFFPEDRDNASALLEQERSWPFIRRQARTHGVFSLPYRKLKRLDFAGVPAIDIPLPPAAPL